MENFWIKTATAAEAILSLREADRERLGALRSSANHGAILDALYGQPIVNVGWVQHTIGVSPTTANKVLDHFCAVGVLREITGNKRNRIYRYDQYVNLFESIDTIDKDHTQHSA
jgi:Fic family protein